MKTKVFCEGEIGDLIFSYFQDNAECSPSLKIHILQEVDKGFDAEFVAAFLKAICTKSASKFLCDTIWHTLEVGPWNPLRRDFAVPLLNNRLLFLLFPHFDALREYCLFHDISLLQTLKKAIEKDGLSWKSFAKKHSYTFKKLLKSYESTFESQDIEDWITEGGELVAFCDLFGIKVETIAKTPRDWNLEEDLLEDALRVCCPAFGEYRSSNKLKGTKHRDLLKAKKAAKEKTIKNFARLFSYSPDKWYGEKYFHKLMRQKCFQKK